MLRLSPPDDLTAQALKRLRGDSDFQRVLEWWKKALADVDQGNRSVADGVTLRMGQGAASCLASIIDHAEGKARQGALRDSPRAPAARSETAR